MVNEDANAKLIRELKEEIMKLRNLLKAGGIEVSEGELGDVFGSSLCPKELFFAIIENMLYFRYGRVESCEELTRR